MTLCLEGFLYSFQISSMFYLELQKNGGLRTLCWAGRDRLGAR